MMQPVTLYLIRHGQASAGFGQAHDPGLDSVGRAQAEAIGGEMESLGPLPLVSSPLRRTRETAAAFEKRWNVQATIERAVAEIPSPTEDLQVRTDWLRQAMQGRWADLPPTYQQWRGQVVAVLLSFGMLLMLWLIDWSASFAGPTAAKILSYLSLIQHLQDFQRGVIDSKDIIFYLSFIFVALFLTTRVVESARWRR